MTENEIKEIKPNWPIIAIIPETDSSASEIVIGLLKNYNHPSANIVDIYGEDITIPENLVYEYTTERIKSLNVALPDGLIEHMEKILENRNNQ